MSSDQQSRTRAFVAEHLKFAHRSQPSDASGCMICTAWTWARETNSMDSAAMKRMLEEIPPIFDISVPSKVEL